ncbi:MAG: vWA domain-containing protein [Terracidiphilus sp.]
MKAVYLFAAAAVLTFPVWTLSAQESVCRTSVLDTAVDQKTNEPVDGLTAGDLRAEFKGHDLPILSLSPPLATRRFVFVLDRSGSMTRPDNSPGQPYNPNQLVRQALGEALSQMRHGDTVAFLAFTGPSSTRTEFVGSGSARAKVSEILAWQPNTQRDGRRTPLWDNIDAALGMLSPHEIGDSIVVVTDGNDNLSKLYPGQVRRKLLEAHVPLLAIVTANPSAPAPEERAVPANFLELIEETGGAVAPLGSALQSFAYRIDSPLPPNQLISQLAHQYELEVEVPPIQKPERWNLSVRTTETGKKLNLFYPRYLASCAAVQ